MCDILHHDVRVTERHILSRQSVVSYAHMLDHAQRTLPALRKRCDCFQVGPAVFAPVKAQLIGDCNVHSLTEIASWVRYGQCGPQHQHDHAAQHLLGTAFAAQADQLVRVISNIGRLLVSM